MKVGDLVRMKHETWAITTARNARTDHAEDVGIVYGIAGKGVKVLIPGGGIKVGLVDHWEVVQAANG